MQYKPISLHYKQKHITMKKQMKQIALPLFLGGLIACSPKTAVNETDLLGNWTEILPPSSNFVQGMTLAKEGKASSIGMATLQYESWQLLPDGQLILNGKSIGNGQTISFLSFYIPIMSNCSNDTITS
jgi:hypothetical protein